MKKIGIATYQYNNYGTKLQNYALKKALEGFGCTVYSLSVRPRKDTFRILAKLSLKTSPIFILKKYGRFNKFGRMHLNLMSITYNGLKRLDKRFDFFMAGSDQIWNPRHLHTRTRDQDLFFLTFTSVKKGIAYAPSFGVESLDDQDRGLYGKYLDGFASLSAREPSGKNIIEQLTGRDATVVPDPTFLLTNEEWSILTADLDQMYSSRKYVVVYYLSDQPNDNYLRIREYAKNNDLEIITISGDLHTKGSIIPDPAEFVSIIKNAQAVFTDSFHACVFSTINQVPFVVRRRTDVSQFTRIENLLRSYDLVTAIDKNKDLAITLKSLNFTKSVEEIENQRKIGLKYLEGALGNER